MLSLNEVHQQDQHVLLRAISGSRAYGLDTPESDTDIKGVYVLPKRDFYSLNPIEQLNNPSNDIVYYEWRKFVALLLGSNPNILELLNTPQHALLYRHPLMDLLQPQWLLSKQCLPKFAGYAYGQIKKARGLNKKMVKPISPQKKTVLDFCYVLQDGLSLPLSSWLEQQGLMQQDLGLMNINHVHDVYALYVDRSGACGLRGVADADSHHVRLSSVPKGMKMAVYLGFNHDGYSSYLREYEDYFKWVSERNEVRYQTNLMHGCEYDSKNMMHTFRLLYTALDIAKHGEVRVWRDNRDELLAIKHGEYTYDELLHQAAVLMKKVEDEFARSQLPDDVEHEKVLNVLVEVRELFYLAG